VIATSPPKALTFILRSSWSQGGLILLFVVFTLLFQEPAETAFGAVQSFISGALGWFMILAVTTFLLFTVILAFTKLGKVRLGGPDAQARISDLRLGFDAN
jgi:choline/glycine/proline betaine transport protein